MTISIEKNGPVTTVILDRPDVRNAVDRPTAEALAAAFRAFDKDEKARVGVLINLNGQWKDMILDKLDNLKLVMFVIIITTVN